MKFECAHADTCLSDYWGGHHLPHVQIPVWPGMTLGQVKSEIRSELSQGAIAGNSEEARLLSADMVQPEEEKQADKLTRAAYAAVNRMRLDNPKKRKLFTDLEPETEDSETVYAFFVFRAI
jgi:hypothetical protein